MRKIIFQNMISIDGHFEGLKKEIDWHNVDEEFNNEAIEFLNTVDTLLFGRLTYELMANYWPTPAAITDDPIIADKMNSMHKIVITKTLDKADWNHTNLIKKNIIEEIKKIKAQSGKDIAIFGSSDLAVALIEHGLIDEIRIMINPIVLGSGKSIFKGIKGRLKLKLLNTKIFKSGNIALYYKPIIGENNLKNVELQIERTFDAPSKILWKAWTDHIYCKRWWGPKDFTLPECVMDVRVGGKYLYCMRSSDGKDYWGTGVYREILPNKKLVLSDSFADAKGNVVPASYYEMEGDFPKEMQIIVTFEEKGDKTKMTLNHIGMPAGEQTEMARIGWKESFDKLAKSLK